MISFAYVLPGLFLVFLIGVMVGVKREQKNTDRVFVAWKRSNDELLELLDKYNLRFTKLLEELREKSKR